jgi:hypothetical protein
MALNETNPPQAGGSGLPRKQRKRAQAAVLAFEIICGAKVLKGAPLRYLAGGSIAKGCVHELSYYGKKLYVGEVAEVVRQDRKSVWWLGIVANQISSGHDVELHKTADSSDVSLVVSRWSENRRKIHNSCFLIDTSTGRGLYLQTKDSPEIGAVGGAFEVFRRELAGTPSDQAPEGVNPLDLAGKIEFRLRTRKESLDRYLARVNAVQNFRLQLTVIGDPGDEASLLASGQVVEEMVITYRIAADSSSERVKSLIDKVLSTSRKVAGGVKATLSARGGRGPKGGTFDLVDLDESAFALEYIDKSDLDQLVVDVLTEVSLKVGGATSAIEGTATNALLRDRSVFKALWLIAAGKASSEMYSDGSGTSDDGSRAPGQETRPDAEGGGDDV